MPHALPIPLELDYTTTPDDAVARMVESPTTKELIRGFCRQLRVGAATSIGVAFVLFLVALAIAAGLDDQTRQNSALAVGMALGMAMYSLVLGAMSIIKSFGHAALATREAKAVSRRAYTGPQHLRIDDAGLEIATPDTSARFNWSAFTRVEETDSYIALIDRFGNTAAMIPRAALADHLPAFLDVARQQMAKAPPRA